MKKLGILGGSFDPIHLSHICLAEQALKSFDLDAVLFMPAAISPLKGHKPFVSDDNRLLMVRAAIEDNPKFLISDYEIKAAGVSYTYRTIKHLRIQYPDTALFWLIGADQVGQLSEWYAIEQLVQIVTFIAFGRSGRRVHPPKIEGLKLIWAEHECPDISSTHIRQYLQEGRPVDLYLPCKVKEIITAYHLYQK